MKNDHLDKKICTGILGEENSVNMDKAVKVQEANNGPRVDWRKKLLHWFLALI